MPSQADRLLRAAHDDIAKLEQRVTEAEDQLDSIEERLTRAGFPRNMQPTDTRTPGQREADQINARIRGETERHDITAPGFPDPAA